MRGTAPSTGEREELVERLATAVPRGRKQPGTPLEQIGPRVLEPARRRSAEGMPANEREARRQLPRGRDDVPLRAAGIGDDGGPCQAFVELPEPQEILSHGSGEDHHVGVREDEKVVRGDVDRMQPHGRLEHVLVVHRNDERLRPELACRERNRSPDQTEADDPDLLEDGGCAFDTTARLDDRKLHGRSLSFPSRVSARARGRCCVQSPAR
jgi:hypothetical protein